MVEELEEQRNGKISLADQISIAVVEGLVQKNMKRVDFDIETEEMGRVTLTAYWTGPIIRVDIKKVE